MNLVIRCTASLPASVMPHFPAPTRRVILSNFRRKSTNTGQRIRRYSLATPGIIRAGQQCLTNCNRKCVMPACSIKGMRWANCLAPHFSICAGIAWKKTKQCRMSMISNCGRWWQKIWIFPLYRHAIAAVISPIFLVADMPQVITLICGRKCWPMMVTSGLLSRAD